LIRKCLPFGKGHYLAICLRMRLKVSGVTPR
jgi:hypothetical protein